MTTGFVEVSGGRLAYETRGAGPPVVLIHAGFPDSRMWDRDVGWLADDYTVVRYDVRGFGQSSRPTAAYSDAADLGALLDHILGETVGADLADQPVLVGVSNGGRIAIDYALEHPDGVRGLVLCDFGVAGYEPTPEEAAMWGALEPRWTEQAELVEAGKLREAAAVDVDVWNAAASSADREWLLDLAADNAQVLTDPPWELQRSPEPPAIERLDELTMPVCMLVGEHDVEGQKALVERLHGLVEGAELHVVEGGDHLPNVSAPAEFRRLVGAFLSDVTG